MNIYLISSYFVILVTGFAVNMLNTCSCDQYNLQDECLYGFCVWNSTISVCKADSCSRFTQKGKCQEESSNCYWNSTDCLPFSKCSSLSGDSTDACSNQNQGCSWTSGSSCTNLDCKFFNSTNCPYFCHTDGSSCAQYTSCSQITTENLCPGSPTCQWKNNSCVASTCESLQSSYCTFVYNSPSNFPSSITPCISNGSACQTANPSDLNSSDQCSRNTYGLYHWSSANSSDGSCVACFELLAQIVLVFLLLIA